MLVLFHSGILIFVTFSAAADSADPFFGSDSPQADGEIPFQIPCSSYGICQIYLTRVLLQTFRGNDKCRNVIYVEFMERAE